MFKYYVIIAILSIFNTILTYLLLTCFNEGFYRVSKHSKPKVSKSIITRSNKFEIQGHNECAGYSSAYLMRHYGKDARGSEVYHKMPHLKNGTILPKHLIALLKSEGFKARYYRGSLDSVKKVVEQGDPVIVFIRSCAGSNLLHYANVVGYDEKYIYIAESEEEYINENNSLYNRKVSVSDFMALWDTSRFMMPLHKNTYITVEGET